MKKVSLIIFLIIFLLLSALIKRSRLDASQEEINAHTKLSHGSIISQKFQAKHNNLSTFKILEANNPIVSNKAVNQEQFRFNLIDNATRNIIRTLDFSGANFGILEKLQFKFDPIIDSKDKIYLLQIQSVSSPAASIIIPEIQFGYSNKINDSNKHGMILGGNANIIGDLAFRTYYKDRMIILVRDSLFDFYHRNNRDYGFIVVYGILLTFILVLLKFIKT